GERQRVEHGDGLEAERLGGGPGGKERAQPLQAIRLRDGEREDDHGGQAAQRGELAQARARREVHREGDDHDDDRGAEIWLGDDETDDGGGDEDERQRDPPRADLVALAAEPRGEVDDERKLRQLRWLKSEAAAEAKPPRRAPRAHADTRDQNGPEQDESEKKERHGNETKDAVVDARGDEHRSDTERGPRRLL